MILHTAATVLASEPTGDVSFWQDYMGVAFDPAHILAEITFTVFFDFVLLFLVWGLFFKKVLLPKIRRDIHREIDAEHGFEHEDDDLDNPAVEIERPKHLSPIPEGAKVNNQHGYPVGIHDLGFKDEEFVVDDLTRSDD